MFDMTIFRHIGVSEGVDKRNVDELPDWERYCAAKHCHAPQRQYEISALVFQAFRNPSNLFIRNSHKQIHVIGFDIARESLLRPP